MREDNCCRNPGPRVQVSRMPERSPARCGGEIRARTLSLVRRSSNVLLQLVSRSSQVVALYRNALIFDRKKLLLISVK